MKFTIKTIGCKVNTYESTKIKEELLRYGFEYIEVDDKDSYKDLDYYIINTCSVTSLADKKSRQMIHSARKYNDKMKIIATGCSVTHSNIDGVDKSYDNEHKFALISDLIKDKEKIDTTIISPVRSFIKIEDGCDQYCTYCIIPYLRGHAHGRDKKEIIDEIKDKTSRGTKEVVLTGIHMSSLGENTLLDIIKSVAELNIVRIRLGSLEPRIITESFVKNLINIEKFCWNFCLSLQSGSNKILKAMNRHYTKEDFENAVNIIKKYNKEAFITTDIIVGFPGETEEDYNETVEFCKKIRFYNPNIFPYSRREGTVADKMENQIPNNIKHDRSVKLIKICEDITKEIEKEYDESKREILIEEYIEKDGKRYGTGYTKEYVRGYRAC